jgi:hypothetical protein
VSKKIAGAGVVDIILAAVAGERDAYAREAASFPKP